MDDFRVLDYVPVGACVIGHDLLVVHWNQRFQDWTGLKSSDVVGHDLLELFPGLRAPRYLRRLRSVLDGGPPAIFSAQLHGHVIPCQLPGGESRVHNTTVSNIVDSTGRSRGALLIAEDVTDLFSRVRAEAYVRRLAQQELEDRKKAEAELKVVAAELAHHNRELDDFASTVAHDLKAPLRHISSFSEILISEYRARLDDDGVHFLGRISRAAASMQRLVSGVLSYSRLTTQAQRPRPIQLTQVIDEVVADLEPELEEHDARVLYRDDLPTVHGDGTQFRQLFANLLGNSLKFAKPGVPPVITIEVAADDRDVGGAANLCITIADNGIGFEPSHALDIFRMCRRLHSDRDYEGSGVGLAIVKRVVERHHGEIIASSTPGQGAVFRVYLPDQTRLQLDAETTEEA